MRSHDLYNFTILPSKDAVTEKAKTLLIRIRGTEAHSPWKVEGRRHIHYVKVVHK